MPPHNFLFFVEIPVILSYNVKKKRPDLSGKPAPFKTAYFLTGKERHPKNNEEIKYVQ